MKKERIYKLVTFLIVMAMTVASVSGFAAAEETAQTREAKVCLLANELSDTRWWEYDTATGAVGGYVGELFDEIKKIDENLNFTFEVQAFIDMNTMDFFDEADMVNAGYDLVVGATIYEKEYYSLPSRWLSSQIVYVTTDPNAPEISDLADLAGTTVMIDKYTFGWMGVRDFNEANPDKQINMELQDSTFIVMGLLDGQYKNAIIDTGYLDNYRQQLASLPSLRIYNLPYMNEAYYYDGYGMGCRVGEEDLGDRITAAMETLINNGTVAELTTKYYGSDRSIPVGEFEGVTGDLDEYQALMNEMILGDAIDYTYSPAEGADSLGDAATGDSAADATADSSGDSAGGPVVYTDANTVYYVQQALNTAGFNCGAPDGSKGNMTNQAIIEFKAANGMDASNADITDELLIKLGLK